MSENAGQLFAVPVQGVESDDCADALKCLADSGRHEGLLVQRVDS